MVCFLPYHPGSGGAIRRQGAAAKGSGGCRKITGQGTGASGADGKEPWIPK